MLAAGSEVAGTVHPTSLVALTSSLKGILFIGFLVMLPLLPLTLVMSRVMRRTPGTESELARGRSSATPFRMISAVGGTITVVAMLFLLLVLGVQRLAG